MANVYVYGLDLVPISGKYGKKRIDMRCYKEYNLKPE